MIIGKRFINDNNLVLMGVQNDEYWHILYYLFYYPKQRYIEASNYLDVSTELRIKISAKDSFDHRVLQNAYDHLAAYFRYVFDPEGQMILPFGGERYEDYLCAHWRNWFISECIKLSQDADIARLILTTVAYQNTKTGSEAENRLIDGLRFEYPLPPFKGTGK